MSDTNHETHCVMLWLRHDKESYRYWREVAEELKAEAGDDDAYDDAGASRMRHALSYTIEQAVRMRDDAPDTGLFGDLVSVALDNVDWSEVADVVLDGLGGQHARIEDRNVPTQHPA